jgi:hypothetical protein
MSIKVIITEEEILARPNHYQLGEFIQQKYWQVIRNQGDIEVDNENSSINVNEKSWLSSTTWTTLEEFDNCVICGKESPYTKSTHIDLRTGYVEGMGQVCFNPDNCKK